MRLCRLFIHFCVCPVLDFQCHASWSFFVFSELKAIVRSVDIGGIVKHRCLNFLFIIKHLCQRLVQNKYDILQQYIYIYMYSIIVYVMELIDDNWIYNCNQYPSPLTLWVRIPIRWGVLDTTFCNKVCQWLVTGPRFFQVSSTNKTDHHDITEILLKVALNTMTLTLHHVNQISIHLLS